MFFQDKAYRVTGSGMTKTRLQDYRITGSGERGTGEATAFT
jgi:hypothetical protein